MAPKWVGAALAACVLVSSLGCLRAAVHEYKNDYFYAVGDAYLYRGGREGLYSSTAEVLSQLEYDWDLFGDVVPGVSNGKSEIKFSKLEFYRPRAIAGQYGPLEGATGLVQAVVFDVNDLDRVGFPTAQGRRYCCDRDLIPSIDCVANRVIVKENEAGWPRVLNIWFENNNTVAKADLVEWIDSITIDHTGMYYLWFVVCDRELSAVQVGGKTIWKNPNGYLPGAMFPNLKFFGVMSLFYLLLGFVWMVLYSQHWREVFLLQHCVTIVIGLGMVEMSTWYFDYVNFNHTGLRPIATTVVAVLLGALRKTLARLLVLLVSMGYGVLRPTLGGLQQKVAALTSAYFVAVSALDVVTNVNNVDDLTSTARIFLVLPVAVLDGVFILWVFTSLSKTLAQLTARKQGTKLQLYKRFTNALGTCVWLSVGWIAFEMYFKVTDSLNKYWKYEWTINAFWYALNFVFLVVICWLWAPSRMSMRYAYSEVETEGDDAEFEDDAEEVDKTAYKIEEGGAGKTD